MTTMMPMPIFLPSGSSAPDRCPDCGKKESTKKVCRHCGYEYKIESGGNVGWDIFWSMLIIFGCIWFAMVIIYWLFLQDAFWEDKKTLIECFAYPFLALIDAIKDAKIW